MFSIWSYLNSQLIDQDYVDEKLDKLKQSLLSPLNDYYKTRQGDKKENPKLKKNENQLIKKISNYLNLDEESCAENYLLYLNSPFNHFIISSDLLEKLQVDELFSAHFLQFVNFYYRERYSFLKIVKLLVSSIVDNSYLNYKDDKKDQVQHQRGFLNQLFTMDDLNKIYKSCVKDYAFNCKEIKNFSNKKNLDFTNADNFQEKNLAQILKELELNLELILILSNLIQLDHNKFQEILKEFNTYSIIKYLTTSSIHTIPQFGLLVDQIINLHTFIIIKSLRLDKLTRLTLGNETENLSFDDKTKLINQDIKTQMNEFIQSYGSNQKASPVILTWSTLLYNLSIDPDLSKVFTPELKSLTNRMLTLSIKENVFSYFLDLLASDIYKNQDLVWYLKQIIYEILNSVFFSFDENFLGDNLRTLYDLTFFCMDKNQVICEHFWNLCKLPDRDNLTNLLSYSLETFPISFSITLTFFSLIAKTSPDLCKQVFEFLTNMHQFCEYLENLGPEEYISSVEQIQLTRSRRILDSITLPTGTKGTILSHLVSASSNIAHRMILQNQAVNWTINFSCLDLVKIYMNKINFAASQNNFVSDNNILAIIQLIDSLFKYFFDIDDLIDTYDYDIYTQYMESYVSSCFSLFSNLMNFESPDSYRLIKKLFELFINISPNIYDKLIGLMQQNSLIGHSSYYDKMNLEELFTNRLNLVKSSTKILYLFKSQDYELIINYFKFIERLIQESGNNVEYLSPLCASLVYVFPEIFKWNNTMINLNIDISITCLNLVHTMLNTSLEPTFANTDFMRNFTSLHSDSLISIDQFCETVLLNTECSEAILNLIYTAYECSQDLNFLNEIKSLDNILIQSVSLINRLIALPAKMINDETKSKETLLSQSNLYFLLVKSITQQNQINSTATNFQSSLLNGSSSTSNDIINKNNEFLLHLNLMMSQTNPYLSKNLTVLNSATITDNKNEINWFHLLTKITIYRSNHRIDCLLFSIFKKISQLTPRLFGSLLGPYTQQMHSIILNKLKSENDGQIIGSLCEFICSLIENQPGFFQTLADIKIESVNASQTDADLNEKFIEGDQSVFKALFEVLERIEKSKGKHCQDYCVSLSGVLSIFYSIWSNKKLNYINYCKQKAEFWPLLSSSLASIKKDLDSDEKQEEDFDDLLTHYSEYFGNYYFNQLSDDFIRFDEFILDAKINSVSCAFKIFSHELFEIIYRKNVDLKTSDLVKTFKQNVIDKNSIEKWLDFYLFQLKRDLEIETKKLFKRIESAALNDDEKIKADMSIIDQNTIKTKNTNVKCDKKLKSKSLLDSVRTILLLINKTTRIINSSTSETKSPENAKFIYLKDNLSMKNIRFDFVLTSLLSSVQSIIDHFLKLNNELLQWQQQQEIFEQQLQQIKSKHFFLNSHKKINVNSLMNSNDSNFISLKQTNEIVKEFQKLSNTIMILITSVNDLDTLADSRNLKKNLINILEQLILDDFNYFPAIINSIQTCLLHLFNLNKNETVNFMHQNEVLLKKLIQNCCKIFIKSITNLEDENYFKKNLVKDCILTFVLNNDLIKFFISNFDEKYWYNELVECCMIQCLYSLFDKYVHKYDNIDIMYSIMDLFFAFSNNQAEHLAKSDFNTRTCLLASKLFEFSTFLNKQSPLKQTDLKSSTKWSSVLKIYINIQTVLLEKLKYNYLKDSILFFGSYFETIAQIVSTLHHSLEIDVLDIIRAFSRYLAQISLYTKELLLNIQNSVEGLQRLFNSIIQLCIMKLSHVRIVSMKVHHNLQTTMGGHQNPLAKISPEDLVNIQNLLFSIISLNLSALSNFAPNFADPNYLIKLDEYRLLLAFQLSPPSSFDSYSPLSFGSILWLIDYNLKILHKYDLNPSGANTSVLNTSLIKNTTILSSNLTPNKRLQNIINSGTPSSPSVDTSPKKNVSILLDETHLDTKLPSKSLVVSILEKSLSFLLSQIVLFERQLEISPKDKKMLKRELNSEINSIIQGLGRSIKKQTVSTSQYPTKSPTASVSGTNAAATSQIVSNLISAGSKQTYEFFKCIQFVLQQNTN